MLDLQSTIETWVMSPDELAKVFCASKIGDTLVYAVGDLAYELWRAKDDGEDERFEAVEDTRDLAFDLYHCGEAELTQKRLGPHKFEYRCTKR